MKIVTIVGARPQFIKAATLSRAITKDASHLCREVLVHTGQHYDSNMSDVFFEEMELPRPHHHLNIGSGTHGAMTGRMLEAIEKVLFQEKPDWVLVYGDTNSTLAGALAAVKLHIPLAHVEAGLRSFNKKMPEEINRILTDHSADILFTPTSGASEQLQREGINPNKIVEVGDVMYEAALHYQHKTAHNGDVLQRLNLSSKGYILATIHRAENTDTVANMQSIITGLNLIAKETTVVWPVHPRTKAVLEQHEMLAKVEKNVKLIPPVGYLDMLALETNATAIITDSGGVQKEAYFFKVPCITLRNETEWTELVEHGFNRLVSLAPDAIFQAYKKCLSEPVNWNVSLYGNGRAASQILDALLQGTVRNNV